MNTERNIFEEYQNANMAKRLHLYLQFRDCRDTFLVLDLKDPKYAKNKLFNCCRAHKAGEKSREPGRWRRFFIHGFACR